MDSWALMNAKALLDHDGAGGSRWWIRSYRYVNQSQQVNENAINYHLGGAQQREREGGG